MNVVYSFRDVSLPRRYRQPVVDSDPFDHQDAVVGFDLSGGLDFVLLGIDLDLTRLQRAGKRAGQSPTGCCHDVIKRRGVRGVLCRIDAVVLGHFRMNAERDRVLLGGQVGEALRAGEPLDPDA